MADVRSGFDHEPRFAAYAQHEAAISARFDALLEASTPQPVNFDDPNGHAFVDADEVSRLWGLFPAGARGRAASNPPTIRMAPARWFARGTSAGECVTTDDPSEAISPTAHYLGRTEYERADGRFITAAPITLYRIPENGFSQAVRRLVQMGVAFHELAHNVNGQDYEDTRRGLQFAESDVVQASIGWVWQFVHQAEQVPPISRYTAAYRNGDNTFPRNGGALLPGPVAEEVADSITAHTLGFIVTHDGMTFSPFANQGSKQEMIEEYLNAQLSDREPSVGVAIGAMPAGAATNRAAGAGR